MRSSCGKTPPKGRAPSAATKLCGRNATRHHRAERVHVPRLHRSEQGRGLVGRLVARPADGDGAAGFLQQVKVRQDRAEGRHPRGPLDRRPQEHTHAVADGGDGVGGEAAHVHELARPRAQVVPPQATFSLRPKPNTGVPGAITATTAEGGERSPGIIQAFGNMRPAHDELARRARASGRRSGSPRRHRGPSTLASQRAWPRGSRRRRGRSPPSGSRGRCRWSRARRIPTASPARCAAPGHLAHPQMAVDKAERPRLAAVALRPRPLVPDHRPQQQDRQRRGRRPGRSHGGRPRGACRTDTGVSGAELLSTVRGSAELCKIFIAPRRIGRASNRVWRPKIWRRGPRRGAEAGARRRLGGEAWREI